ncbi:ABC transporter substrate-binding protein [Mameliella sediminis]|uniref:ABC transporter substrate-binding protein n=1 Tax=Mameliella sediminis TaxID=2836866 RepID=UPI001C4512A9|nr:ABC transporter substrate-binding protein [Mameliella sediminis]MBY6115197.1 ABC transporter substrate-binding protein [Antarctobacter heliothermus]MBY6144918.1 ABC transporter substrate-binding protein [Mameliella alba]MBV7396033.1 ABC transporter substrate-binding protein [Mameliella sediminis]MBY6160444.1 ABC transporter substrate-binding protein [Mameliella alba]MBY6168914.1 ABC transporter substrate-binding protein [Mameliella alba]
MKLTIYAALACGLAGAAFAQNDCAAGKTLTDGTLTVATGNPAFFPWVLDDAPESGKGYEAAVAYAVAAEMGFAPEQVTWVRTSFDQSIQPGAKDFDFNLQQFSITEDREKVVDFSLPYYSSAMAVLTTQSVVDAGAEPKVENLKSLLWGADANTTAVPMLTDLIDPDKQPMLYGDNVDVTAAMQAGQIDAALFDLPTALYLAAVVLENGVILGQFPPERTENPDQFGLLMEEGSALKPCVNAALTALKDSGKLAEIEAEWLQETTGVPVIE